MPPDRISFVSPSAFKQMVKDKKDVSTLGILKSAPVLGDLTKAVDRAARTIDFVISTAAVDRDNDTIDLAGWDINNYVNNPVVLFAHDHWQPPVAQSLALTNTEGQLRSKAFFTPKDLYPFGDMIFEFYANGFMRATSVGYKPKEWKFNDDRKYGVDYLSQELLEYSCVPVPSNPEALMQARAKGIDVNPLKAWCERLLDDQRMASEAAGHTRDVLERIRSLTIDGKTLFVHMGDLKMPGEPKKADEPKPKAEEPPTEPAKDDTTRVLKLYACKSDHTTHRTLADADLCDLRAEVGAAIVASFKTFHPDKDVTEKVGRVLNAANEARLRSAAAKGEELNVLIREVLAAVEEQEEEQDDDSKAVKDDSPDFFTLDADPNDLGLDATTIRATMAQVLGEEVRAQLRAITGRVD